MTDDAAMALMLLTVPLGQADGPDVQPLDAEEWSRLRVRLRERQLEPEALLRENPLIACADWDDPTITPVRIERLLARGVALAMSLERWERAGIWAMTRDDPDYPKRLTKRMRQRAFPVLFGCGDRSWLNRDGLAVVGSSAADADEIAVAGMLGGAVGRRHAVPANGRRPFVITSLRTEANKAAMAHATVHGGKAICVIGHNLLGATVSLKTRARVLTGTLTLVSPFPPEGSAGPADAADRLIHGLSDASFVVASRRDGATWQGAAEAIKAGWLPVSVKKTDRPGSGNADLARLGAKWIGGDSERPGADRGMTPG